MKIIVLTKELFTAEELRCYEEQILDNKGVNEQTASKFFESFPKFLSCGGYSQLSKEVFLYRGDGHPVFRIDFVRRQIGRNLWDIVELKSPKEPVLVKNGLHWKLSSKLEAAAHQSLDYREFINEYNNRVETEKRTGVKIFNPKILLIGGRRSENMDEEELRKISFRYNNIDIFSYEDLYDFAKDNYKSSLIGIPILQSSQINVPIFSEINLSYTFKSISNSIARPLIPIALKNPKTADSFLTYGIIDTGADICAIPADFAKILNCNLNSNKMKKVLTANGEANVLSYPIEINIYRDQSDHIVLREELEVDFLQGLKVVLLGNNFLSGFEVKLDYANNLFSLVRK
jgi:hypothetical protein